MTSSTHAQVATDEFGIERFRLPMSSSGLLDVNWADVPGHLSWGLGLWLGFAHDPLVIYDRDHMPIDSLVAQRLTTGFVGSLGLWNRLELGLAFDVVGYQAGAESTPVMADLPSAGAGDLRAAVKVLVVGGPGSRYHVAIIPAATVPMGAAGGYLREAGPTFAPELAIGAIHDRLRGGVNVGYRVRERLDNAGLIIDDELFARAGAGLGLGDVRNATEVSVSLSFAAPARNAERNQVALEAMAGGSRRVANALRVFVAAGVGLDNGFGVPDWRGIAGIRIDGVRGDRDSDGIDGVADRCPDGAEDKDGFEDDDGCPDDDNDRDGIADARDRCPAQAEDRDRVQDDDGCPDLDNDGDAIADGDDKCPATAEDKDGFADSDGCPDASGKVTGRVVDPEGLPIARTAIVVQHLDHGSVAAMEVVTGDDGSFAIDSHGGSLKLLATASEYQPGEATTRVEPGAAASVTVTLARKIRQGQLRGQILSFNGKPLAATVEVSGKTVAKATAGSARTTTDAEGFFTLELPEGAFEVVISSDAHTTQRRKVNVKLDGVTVLNVDMRKAP